ncbi:10941_t:CDS:2 [Entrophospora sp. SA101]|nr:10941_t:CDS:2 [Entrophospora sp. SA101]
MIEDHKKMMGDRDKILKAMQLALFQLEQIMRNSGINDKKKLQQNLEIFGILVYTGFHFLCDALL